MKGCVLTLLCLATAIVAGADNSATLHFDANGRLMAYTGPAPALTNNTQQELFNLTLLSSNRAFRRVRQSELTCASHDATGRELRFTSSDGRFGVDLSVTNVGWTEHWIFRLRNQGDELIVNFEFTALAGVACSSDSELYVPWIGGQRIPDPAAYISEKNKRGERDWDDVNNKPLLTDSNVLVGNMIGRFSMGWMYLRQPTAGLYVALLDRDFLKSDFYVTAAADRTALNFVMDVPILVRPGSTGEVMFASGINRGDWHEAADAYRAWANSWLPPDGLHPDWIRRSPGWWCEAYSGRCGSFWEIEDYAFYARDMGADILYLTGTGAEHVSCSYVPYPTILLGGPEVFSAATQHARERYGLRIAMYLNSTRWPYDVRSTGLVGRTPVSAFPAALQDQLPSYEFINSNAVRRLNGDFDYGWRGGDSGRYLYHEIVMDPAQEGWRNHLEKLFNFCIGPMAVDFVYLDQTSVSRGRLCYCPDCLQAGIGRWNAGLLAVFSNNIERIRQKNPDFTVGVEGSVFAISKYSAPDLVSHTHTFQNFKEMYRYTFPEALLIYGQGNANQEKREFLEDAFLYGMACDTRWFTSFQRTILDLKSATADLLATARFRDEAGLSYDTAGSKLRMKCFAATNDDYLLINAVNRTGNPVDCTLTGLPSVPAVFFFGPNGETARLEPRRERDQVRIAAPNADLFTLLVLKRSREELLLLRARAGDDLRLTVVNLSERSRDCALSSAVNGAGVALKDGATQLAAPAFGLTNLSVRLERKSDFSLPVEVRTTLSSGALRRTASSWLRPLVLNPEFKSPDRRPDVPFWDSVRNRVLAYTPYQCGRKDRDATLGRDVLLLDRNDYLVRGAFRSPLDRVAMVSQPLFPVPGSSAELALTYRTEPGAEAELALVYLPSGELVADRNLYFDGKKILILPLPDAEQWTTVRANFKAPVNLDYAELFLVKKNSERRAWFSRIDLVGH